jgi:NADPH2:quinone reductase
VSDPIPAAVLKQYGQPPELDAFAAPPPPSDGQVLVEIEFAGLNPVDVALGDQRYTFPSPPVPYVPGIEGVGRVIESGAPDIRVGERVYFDIPVAPHGTFAVSALGYAATAVPISGDVDGALACALGIAGVAAHAALDYRAKLQPGEKVVVLGATGVVGTIAVQVARLMGAEAIVAVGRNRERLEAVGALGATALAQIGESDLTATILDATGGGADVVIDTLCGPPAEAALEAIAAGGRHVQLGRSAGETMTITSATVRGRAASIIGHTNALTPPEARRATFEFLVQSATSGELRVEVETVPLAAVADAWTRQRDSPGHKLVIAPGI